MQIYGLSDLSLRNSLMALTESFPLHVGMYRSIKMSL